MKFNRGKKFNRFKMIKYFFIKLFKILLRSINFNKCFEKRKTEMGKQRGMKILRESEENICHG